MKTTPCSFEFSGARGFRLLGLLAAFALLGACSGHQLAAHQLAADVDPYRPLCQTAGLAGEGFKLVYAEDEGRGSMVVQGGKGFRCKIKRTPNDPSPFPECMSACMSAPQNQAEWGWCPGGEAFSCTVQPTKTGLSAKAAAPTEGKSAAGAPSSPATPPPAPPAQTPSSSSSRP